jgi:hypothetical protein
VIGKLLAQAVKLATLFAAMAPFIVMCFLLGGIDLVTILVSLVVLFFWSLWACAACLFLSTLFKSRAMSGLVFGGVALLVLIALVASRPLMFALSTGAFGGAPASAISTMWWTLAIAITACLVTMVNFVLLAENRLSLPTEDRSTALRIGFFVQFLAIASWILSFAGAAAAVRSNAVEALGVAGGLHLALVAMFAVSEDLTVSRQVRRRLAAPSRWRRLAAIWRPGGGRGAVYLLVQMLLLLGVGWALRAEAQQMRWLLAICAYVCFFAAVPVFAYRWLQPGRAAAFRLRVAILVLLAVVMVLPDVLHYVVLRPAVLDLEFSARHLVNPIRTLGNWRLVEIQSWFAVPYALGLAGVVASLGLAHLGRRMSAEPAAIEPHGTGASAGEPGSANLY